MTLNNEEADISEKRQENKYQRIIKILINSYNFQMKSQKKNRKIQIKTLKRRSRAILLLKMMILINLNNKAMKLRLLLRKQL